MKHMLTFVATVLWGASLVAETEVAGGATWSYAVTGGQAEVMGRSYVMTIPPTLGGCPVTSIGAHAFQGCKGLSGVTIPGSVTSIGAYAFADCESLESVTVPDGVTAIGEYAFANCSSLIRVSLPYSFRDSLDETVFADCQRNPTVIFRAGVYTVSFDANGGSVPVASKRVAHGDVFGNLPVATKAGSFFCGWYTAKEGGAKIGATTPMEEKKNLTLYARWESAFELQERLRGAIKAYGCGLSTDGDAPWSRAYADGHCVPTWDNQARSGTICDGESSSLTVSVSGAGRISFSWRVSSEEDYDTLSFSVDGVKKSVISGEQEWASVSFYVTGSGTHELRWTYAKDGSASEGSDCGWLRDVSWSGDEITARVTFNANGGRLDSPSAVDCPIGDWYDEYLPNVKRDGYVLLGWYTALSGGLDADDYRVQEYPITLYAHWSYAAPGSHPNSATRLNMGSGIRTESVSFVREWSDDSEDDDPEDDEEWYVHYYRLSLEKGMKYTFAVPSDMCELELGGDEDCYYCDDGVDDDIDCDWAYDGALEYMIVDTTEMSDARRDIVIQVYSE